MLDSRMCYTLFSSVIANPIAIVVSSHCPSTHSSSLKSAAYVVVTIGRSRRERVAKSKER